MFRYQLQLLAREQLNVVITNRVNVNSHKATSILLRYINIAFGKILYATIKQYLVNLTLFIGLIIIYL